MAIIPVLTPPLLCSRQYLWRSISLLSPLLSEDAKRTPYWKSWVAHVRVLEMSLRSSFTLADVMELDDRIKEHHRLLLKVCFSRRLAARPPPHRCDAACPPLRCHEPPQPCCVTQCVTQCVTHCVTCCVMQVKEYNGLWKPKHHFMTHLPVDLLRFGPLRGFWCMSFEGFNKIVKQAAEISNYRSEDVFVLEHWMMKSAKKLRSVRDKDWYASI